LSGILKGRGPTSWTPTVDASRRDVYDVEQRSKKLGQIDDFIKRYLSGALPRCSGPSSRRARSPKRCRDEVWTHVGRHALSVDPLEVTGQKVNRDLTVGQREIATTPGTATVAMARGSAICSRAAQSRHPVPNGPKQSGWVRIMLT